MNWKLIARCLGILSLLIGAAMVTSLPWAFPACGQTATFETLAFRGMLMSIGICTATGIVLLLLSRGTSMEILRKEALAVVGLGWILSGILGALPFVLTPTYSAAGRSMSLIDGVFESVSGFTTTGASVLTELDRPTEIEGDPEINAAAGRIAWVPRCVLFWRSFTHWLGGMGIIVLFVAILGQLGATGKALMRREVPGPISETVRPRTRETAIILWSTYVGLSLLETVVLMFQGMDLYDALCHTFGTMATGGFSTHTASVGEFGSAGIELTITLFMIAAGTNFTLYFMLVKPPLPGHSWRIRQRIRLFVSEPEFRLYLTFIALAIIGMVITLLRNATYESPAIALRHAMFNCVSIMTTTGFGTENFATWPATAQGILLLLMFVGGCAGSTGGGIKVIRCLLLAKILWFEVERAFRPNVVRPLRLAGARVNDGLKHDVVVYTVLIGIIFAVSWFLLIALEPNAQWRDQPHPQTAELLDCASAVAATLNNIGPGLGVCGPHANYLNFSGSSKVLMTLLMLLGRLELFAILVLLVPAFWMRN